MNKNYCIQTELDFSSPSPINKESLARQNRAVYELLLTGEHISIFSESVKRIGCKYLNTRISELKNHTGVAIKSRFVKINDTTCKEYWIDI